MQRTLIVYTLFVLTLPPLQAQDTVQQYNPEKEFGRMRSLAAAGDYDTAKQIGYKLLRDNEAYYDAALFLARIHGWESSFDSAYRLIDRVLAEDPGLYEA